MFFRWKINDKPWSNNFTCKVNKHSTGVYFSLFTCFLVSYKVIGVGFFKLKSHAFTHNTYAIYGIY